LSRDNDRIDKLTTQLSFRLNEGNGRAQYRIGVEDGGSLSCLSLEDLESSVVMLNMMAESVSATLKSVERIEYKLAASTTATAATTSEKDDSAAESSTTSYYYAIVNIEACYDDDTTKVDIRIAVCGNVDAGKSTCIGVMKTGMLDDGRGSARTTTMIHSHEIESGRTSTVSHHVIGFKNDGRITNYEQGSRQPSVDMITQQSVRLLTFIDLAGHEKYLRSMIYGVSSTLLDYSLVLINARSGVTHMTHHHLTVCCMMNIPIVILFTKVDSCPAHRYKQTVEETRELLKAPDVRKRLMLINTQQAKGSDAENPAAGGGSNNTVAAGTDSYGGRTSAAPTTTSTAAGAGANLKAPTGGKPDDEKDSKTATVAALALHSVLTCLTATRQVGIPAFPVSFTEGTNLEFLRRLCRFLPKRRKHADKKSENLEYIVDRIYSVPGVGPVLYGFVNQGTVSANKAVWIGPFTTGTEGKGEFSRSNVKTIHYNCLPVKSVGAGNFCTLAVKLDKLQIRNIRRGMVLMETGMWCFVRCFLFPTLCTPTYYHQHELTLLRSTYCDTSVQGKNKHRFCAIDDH